MTSREEFEAYCESELNLRTIRLTTGDYQSFGADMAWRAWKDSAAKSDLLKAILAITNSGPDAIPIKEAFEMAHRAIERATGGNV